MTAPGQQAEIDAEVDASAAAMGTLADERHRRLGTREAGLDVRDRWLDQRQDDLDHRNHLAAERDHQADLRDQRADDRDSVADERDRRADQCEVDAEIASSARSYRSEGWPDWNMDRHSSAEA